MSNLTTSYIIEICILIMAVSLIISIGYVIYIWGRSLFQCYIGELIDIKIHSGAGETKIKRVFVQSEPTDVNELNHTTRK